MTDSREADRVSWRIEEIAPRLRAAGHTVEWGFDGPVMPNAPGDPGWWCKVDGEVVARGAAIGLLEEALERWLAAHGSTSIVQPGGKHAME